MISIFENIISAALQSSSLLAGAKIICLEQSRLGGQIMYLQLTSQKQAFAKDGFEMFEIMREYKNIQALQGHCNVPKVYDYIISNDQAVIVLENMPGYPLSYNDLVTWA